MVSISVHIRLVRKPKFILLNKLRFLLRLKLSLRVAGSTTPLVTCRILLPV